jgi:hypothetical protein
MVSDYAIGTWQITRETLRAAHQLYLHDKRDYSLLPARLRPPRQLDLNSVDDAVLTTYAGLLLRGLLDHFGGDVDKAIGAYNGGVKTPNPAYAAGVRTVAEYARRVLEHATALEDPAPNLKNPAATQPGASAPSTAPAPSTPQTPQATPSATPPAGQNPSATAPAAPPTTQSIPPAAPPPNPPQQKPYRPGHH